MRGRAWSIVTQAPARVSAWLAEPVSRPAAPAHWQADAEIQATVDAELAEHLERHSEDVLRAEYAANDGFVFVPNMVPAALIRRVVVELPRLRVFRSLAPWIRQAGSADYMQLQQHAPVATAVYRSAILRQWCERLCGHDLFYKSDRDPHATAMYFYTRSGDWMSYHRDDCGCPDSASYTVILGLENRSTQEFLAQLHTGTPKERRVRMATHPGDGVFFCGSKVPHGVSRMGRNEHRTVQSISYQTGEPMSRGSHVREIVKDALLYFGPSAFRTRRA